ncbi:MULTISPECIES: caspase family protein [Flammeovirga]|uniref:Peptidase C14 caspase domain-containing protein n=1 Tax=Flammeovirga agarivorans TaxID=2726742 RepID=A0A7X8XUU1_9BACT|nr:MULTISPECIES: caspase family protein [Flammeovirga]NLR90722.1 hypothetical protein [Flammeovirga agarivorans]
MATLTANSQTIFPDEFNQEGNERFPSITSDGKTLLFARENSEGFDFYLSNKVDGKFMPPTQLVIPKDMPYPTSPMISYDGRWIYFSAINGENGSDLYRIKRWGRRLGKPELLPEIINSGGYEMFPSITKNGDGLYFTRLKEGSDPMNLQYAIYYASIDKKGNFGEPVKLPEPVNLYSEKEPRIMPDGKTLVFLSKISDESFDYEVMYVTKSDDGSWSDPMPMVALNNGGSPHSPCIDGIAKKAYYSKDGSLAYIDMSKVFTSGLKEEDQMGEAHASVEKSRSGDQADESKTAEQQKQEDTQPKISPFSDLGFDIVEYKPQPVYRAVIIGINQYQDEKIANLDKPEGDAASIEEILVSNYTFPRENVISLKSPTREQIIETLDNLMEVSTENDHILIFYAGHGHWDPRRKAGYWLPSDAKAKSTANWVRNSTIKEYIASYRAKHVLLVSDACFSGGIFKTRAAFDDAEKSIKSLEKLPSRKAMTSGTLKEVPDESVFVKYLQKRLLENTEKYISARSLFDSFRVAVMNNSENVPQFGVINSTGDEGGDFIFIKK